MDMNFSRPALLALAIAAATGTAHAQSAAPATPTPETRQAMEAARAEMDAAVKRYAELARRHGEDARVQVFRERLLDKPVIGVVLAPAREGGVRIAGVTPGSAAAKAGLESGDRIVAVDGKALAGSDAESRLEAVREAIGAHEAGSTLSLRYERDGRQATVTLAPEMGDRVVFLGSAFPQDLDVQRIRVEAEAARGHALHARADAMRAVEHARMAAIAPQIRREVIADALRWQGLNLAMLNPELGRYFGTDQGVLVLGAGDDLEGLRAGDVIRSVDGDAVATPRDVMEALRGRKAGDKVDVGYLRDKRTGSTVLTVPEAMHLPIPPAHPAPPAPPAAPAVAPPPPPAPPAPPVPPQLD